MPIDRRRFLLSAAGLSLLSVLPVVAQEPAGVRYLSASSDLDGKHYINGFDGTGRLCFSIPLESRGHGVAVSPDGRQAVAVARRPGRHLVVIDLPTGQVLQRLESGQDRHFYGHGLFSADGSRFYTPENDFTRGTGVIGIRDVKQGYRQVGEFSSHGIGPHEAAMLSDGHTLVVANGGIKTHPDTGRAKLNLESMQSSLAYIDSRNGALLEQCGLGEALCKNSIRHLAVAPDDQVCCVMQFQGKRTRTPPLIGLHRRGQAMHLLRAPDAVQQRMRNYCGSACTDLSGEVFAVSSPRGNLISFWSAGEGEYLGMAELQDGCGIARGDQPGEFLLSSGEGVICRYQLVDKRMQQIATGDRGFRWDNHMIRI